MHTDDDIGELYGACNDLCEDIEIELEKFSHNRSGDLDGMFRSIHTIKGNAGMMQLSEIVTFTHSIEEVFVSLRDQKLSMTEDLSEAIRYGIERIKDLHVRHLFDKTLECPNLEALETAFRTCANATQPDLDQCAVKIINLFNQQGEFFDETQITCITQSQEMTKTEADLLFFRGLAKQVDNQSRYWNGRSDQLNNWALRLNTMRGSPVDPDQLSAAVYMHDIGMCYINNEILGKKTPLTVANLKELHMHPLWGYHYLLRINGWDTAATMILEHHERIDGQGYPNGNTGDLIHEGSKLLAVIDAFFSITNSRADRAHRRSTMKATAEINSCAGTQFDEQWVLAFNDLLKEELKSGSL